MPISQIIFELFEGLLVSVQIFGITLLFSLPFGLVVALGRMSKNTTISTITKVYISIMRGTPLMLQLFVVYYGPYYLFNIKLNPTYRNMAVYIGFIILPYQTMFFIHGVGFTTPASKDFIVQRNVRKQPEPLRS